MLEAAQQRIAWVFDTFPRIYASFSGGKDSGVMLHLIMDAAKKRDRKVGVLFVDLEGQYKLTIDFIQQCYDMYADYIEPYWVALPIALRNAVSQYEPKWTCWEPGREADWIRQPAAMAITDQDHFPFYRYNMEFEEFVPAFGHWYSQSQLTACFVGIRTGESLNRWRTIAGHGMKFKDNSNNLNWTNYIGQTLYNIYPIYDWHTHDIWTYHAKHPDKPHNRLYDLMHKAGLTPHQMRICQPYGDDQRKGLWLFHLIEPETWTRVVARVNGANSGALYAQEQGNILGNGKITRPEGHTWEGFCHFLLDSMPPKTADHYKDKIAVFLHWWQERDYPNGIPDEAGYEDEKHRRVPSWRRIAKVLVRGDWWCKGLSFSQTKSEAYVRYKKIMEKRRIQWGIFPLSDME